MASKLFVGGLPYSTTSEDLRGHFAQCGTVVSATVIADRVTGQSRGFGFVEMSTETEAQGTIAKLNGQPLQGRRFTVNVANQSGVREPGPRSRDRESRFGGAFGSGPRRAARW
jgi:RNA recognition motif-containing protein